MFALRLLVVLSSILGSTNLFGKNHHPRPHASINTDPIIRIKNDSMNRWIELVADEPFINLIRSSLGHAESRRKKDKGKWRGAAMGPRRLLSTCIPVFRHLSVTE